MYPWLLNDLIVAMSVLIILGYHASVLGLYFPKAIQCCKKCKVLLIKMMCEVNEGNR